MTRFPRFATAACRVLLPVALLALTACATPTAPAATDASPAPSASPSPAPLAVGQEAVFEGEIVSIDTNPWAYDGNAIVQVATIASGTIQVQLPARWNLCRAESFGDLQAFKPGDGVHVAGTVTEPGVVVVCEQPQHHLRMAR
jgi:hypothetical protein